MESEIFKCIKTENIRDESNFPVTIITLDRDIKIFDYHFDYHYWITGYIDEQITVINKKHVLSNNQIIINYPFLYELHRDFKYCLLSVGYPEEEFLWNCFNCKYADDQEFINYIIWLLTLR